MDSPQVITHHLPARCLFPTGDEITVELGYAADDPFAVQICLDEPAVSHEVARSVLEHGLMSASGHGQVRAWPQVDERGRSLVVLDLRGDDHEVVLEVATTALDGFLQRTRRMVPAGTELDRVDLDDVVSRLLASDSV